VGIDLGTPVVEAIGAEHRSKFNGRIDKVTVEVHAAAPRTATEVRQERVEPARTMD
jgi:arylsulfatase